MQNNYPVLKPRQGIMKPGPGSRFRLHITINLTRTFTLVNDFSAAQFVTINVDGGVTSNDTCVVIIRPSSTQ